MRGDKVVDVTTDDLLPRKILSARNKKKKRMIRESEWRGSDISS